MDAVVLALSGLLAGVTSVVLGVGGGIVVVPILIAWRHMDAKAAVATSLAMIVPTALVGVLRKPAGLVDWRAAAILGVAAVAGAFAGERLSESLSSLAVKRIFAAVMVIVAVRLAFD